ncbi:transmembrane protein 42a isoform X2 [Oncorhynchus tshawytscha]|uniref:transmembrane protein 42a isoform X2 n=1 Tax=Oncorhynchus tshawytscha TaxID=74940 RepID=UPI001C3D2555|nr:transmembrane protein 42a isoform X2 [Oncorhynchus tshawytscha]
MISGAFYALLAGFLGAVASSSAKLSLGSDYLKGMCETGLKTWSQDGDYRIIPEETSPCEWLHIPLELLFTCNAVMWCLFQLHIPLRLLCGGLLFTSNAVMWTFFSKALRHSSSSARATVTTTASNFVSSIIMVKSGGPDPRSAILLLRCFRNTTPDLSSPPPEML